MEFEVDVPEDEADQEVWTRELVNQFLATATETATEFLKLGRVVAQLKDELDLGQYGFSKGLVSKSVEEKLMRNIVERLYELAGLESPHGLADR